MAIPLANLREVRDYQDGMIKDQDGPTDLPHDKLIEKYLTFQIENNGLTCGKFSAAKVIDHAKLQEIDIPDAYPRRFVNNAIYESYKRGIPGYEMVEIIGVGGINIAWWYECTKQTESQ